MNRLIKPAIATLATVAGIGITIQPLIAQTDATNTIEYKKKMTISNAKQIALGLLMYTSDNDDLTPRVRDTETLKVVTYPYIKNADIWKTLNPNGGEFLFNLNLGGVNIAKVKEPAETPAVYETKLWPDKTQVVAFLDGHAKFLNPDEQKRANTFLAMKQRQTAAALPKMKFKK